MSALELMINKMLTTQHITDAVAGSIHAGAVPQGATPPLFLVYKPAQENRQLLQGSAKWPRSRISIECHGQSAAQADSLGELLMAELEDVTNEVVLNNASPSVPIGTITILPADSDVDDYDDVRQAFRRIIDFYVDWRAAP